MRKPVVKVTAQSEQELIYLQGTIVKKAIDVTIDYPNGVQFQQLAIDNTHTKAELDLLDLTYKNDRAVYADAIGKIQHLRDELEYEQKRITGNDYDEGERRQRVKVLTEQLVQVQTPIPPNEEIYHVQRALLEMKLKENAHVNASILVWESTRDRRN